MKKRDTRGAGEWVTVMKIKEGVSQKAFWAGEEPLGLYIYIYILSKTFFPEELWSQNIFWAGANGL